MAERRTGASRVADVPPDVLAALNAGTAEAATLAEGLAVDFAALAAAAFPDLPADAVRTVRAAAAVGVKQRMERVGQLLLTHLGSDGLARAAAHRSDTVRGWACFAVALTPGLSLADRLRCIRPLAADPHFGVREWAWMAVRPHVAAELPAALAALAPWTAEASANLRRFAVEVTRPRGVWCAHLPALKADPTPGLPLLEPLRADGARYVQDSVANWLNDAGKSRPDWVRELCRRWAVESPGAATERVCARAGRNLGRAG